MAEWYANRIVLGGGEITEADEEAFRQAFASPLTSDQIELLVRWHRQGVDPHIGGHPKHKEAVAEMQRLYQITDRLWRVGGDSNGLL